MDWTEFDRLLEKIQELASHRDIDPGEMEDATEALEFATAGLRSVEGWLEQVQFCVRKQG